MNFTVLSAIYHKENPQYFHECMQSIWENQSIKPKEMILVKDGTLTPELDQHIAQWQNKLGDALKVIALEHNVGLGQALNHGLTHCQHDWVFRMDTDDICASDRFEKQTAFLTSHPEIDVLGGQIIEFENHINENTLSKTTPLTHAQIAQYAQSRNPINHMTVAFRKSAVLDAGNYRHAPLYEDYDLWVRLLLNQCQFANLPDILVYARAGRTMYERRGGTAYLKNEIAMQRAFCQMGFLTHGQMLKNLAIRLPVRLLPNGLRAWVYRLFLRQSAN